MQVNLLQKIVLCAERRHLYQIDYTRLAKQQDDQNLDMLWVLRQVPDVSRYGKAI